MARRTTWLIDMGDGTWAVSCMACRIALYRGPKAGADRAAAATTANPSSPSAAGAGRPERGPARAPVRRRDPGPTPWTDAPPTANPTLVKEQLVNPRIGWGQPPTGWGQPHLPGWAPLVDHGPLPLRAASSVARWWWPTAAVSGFLAVVVYVLGHDDPTPGLSQRGLVTVALAAVVVVLLTIHRRYGPGSLARAVAEYAVVALLATLLAPPPAAPSSTSSRPTAPPASRARPRPRPVMTSRPVSEPGPRSSGASPARPGPSPARSAGWSTCGARPTSRPDPPRGRRWPPRPAPLPAPCLVCPLASEVPVTKFRHLPAAGRAIIVVVAVGVLAIAVVACATSYNAIYRLVGQLGLYGYRINQAFPLMLDAAFLVAELAAILGGIMRAVTRSDEVSAGWPGAAMLLCGLGTIGFNVGHAYLLGGRGDPLTVWRCVVAALPPVLMILSFQVLIAIVKWVMLHLGRPLNSAAALTPTPMPGYGMAPPASPYGLFPPHPV